MRCILMFAKAPIAGKVKTRLTPPLSQYDAAKIQEAFIFDTLETLQTLRSVDLFMACYPSTHIFYNKVEEKFNLNFIDQGDGNLGERLKRVVKHLQSQGYKQIVILGSDSPSIPAKLIEDSFRLLKEKDAVIGPSVDGGYYLIGLSCYLPGIFGDISWGGDTVFAETVGKIISADADYSVLPFWYDVDTIKELRFLEIHLSALEKSTCRQTREFIEKVRLPLHSGGIYSK